MSHKERRQSTLSKNQLCYTALGYVAKFMKSDTHIVERKSQRLSMEVAARNH